MKPLANQVTVTAASGFLITWRAPAPFPAVTLRTVTARCSLLFRTESADGLLYPMIGFYGSWSAQAPALAPPNNTTLIDPVVPVQFTYKPGTSLWRAVVSARAATSLRTHFALRHPTLLPDFFLERDRHAFVASTDPLLFWVYGPAVPPGPH
ncbi:MAG: hypothetical protein ACK5U7_07560 [Bacteroidota bacterium]|jgi:hypothetical protein